MSLLNVCTVLIFFIAGLLFLCLEHVIHRELIASRWRPAFSSHLVSQITGHLAPSTQTDWWDVKLFYSLALNRSYIAGNSIPNFWHKADTSRKSFSFSS